MQARSLMTIVSLVSLASGAMLPMRAAHAQASRPIPRALRVVDDSLGPIERATATLFDSLGRTVRVVSTDGAGVAPLVPGDSSARRATVRRVGFVPVTVSFGTPAADTMIVRLERSVAVLDEVVTSGRRTSKDYSVGAREIAASTRGLYSALDVLTKLRPQMLGDGMRQCGAANKVWINGVRVYFFPGGTDSPATHEHGRPHGSAFAQHYAIVDTVLSTIHAGDLEEVKYTNCWDKQPEGIERDALYIVLKNGVDWDWKHGSFRP